MATAKLNRILSSMYYGGRQILGSRKRIHQKDNDHANIFDGRNPAFSELHDGLADQRVQYPGHQVIYDKEEGHLLDSKVKELDQQEHGKDHKYLAAGAGKKGQDVI